ncbi:MAG: DUF1992 domain-containing protein [Desulfobacteraceae bacterium]|nr:MAG: DUF1992 domain-containing protein [Desulfobacteraceae bacterium]
MIPGFEAIVEERIKKAQQEGQFDNLEGSKKPLNFDDLNVPEEFRLAHKILKNSGFLPPEIELKKKIASTQELIGSVEPNSPQRQRLQKKLNFLLTKLETSRPGSTSGSMMTELYREQLINKIS